MSTAQEHGGIPSTAVEAAPGLWRTNLQRAWTELMNRLGGSGYFIEQATRPQTIGYALLDSPVALAAWMLDHDTDSYYKISHASSTSSPRETSPRTISSTTSRCTG